jgi:N-acetylglutamate synthase-like GNAT family acetyltransferase
VIRVATRDDMQELLRMGRSFFNDSGYSYIAEFNEETTVATLELLIDAGTILTDGKTGMIGFLIFPLFMDKACVVAQELFWWVDKENRKSKLGIELLKSAELLAKEMGAKSMIMLSLSSLDGEKVNALYESLGYTKRESNYMRVL